MKKLILISILCMVSLAGHSPPNYVLTIVKNKPIEPFLGLFKAITIVESRNDSLAYNSASEATGIAQVTPILLKDYNQRTGKRYTLHDCYSIKISKEIFMFYCMLYRTSDFEYLAKRWNGSGHKTIHYWNEVKKQLNKNINE
jgi:hypothetical protein